MRDLVVMVAECRKTKPARLRSRRRGRTWRRTGSASLSLEPSAEQRRDGRFPAGGVVVDALRSASARASEIQAGDGILALVSKGVRTDIRSVEQFNRVVGAPSTSVRQSRCWCCVAKPRPLFRCEPLSADRQLIVLSRMWCHLCHDLLTALAPLQDELGFFGPGRGPRHRRPELEEVWGEKVPVLLDGDVELCHYFLDESAVRAHFRRIG